MGKEYYVTVDRDNLKEQIKQVIWRGVKDRMGSIGHDTRDDNYSPARWFRSEPHDKTNFGDRYALMGYNESANSSMSFDNGTIKVNLIYHVIPWPKW